MLLLATLLLVHGDLPRALVEFERARAKIERADIHWDRIDYKGSFVPGVPKQFRGMFTEHEKALIADGTVATGSVPAGICGWTVDGEPVYESRYSTLLTRDEYWSLDTDRCSGRLKRGSKATSGESDARLFGAMPYPDFSNELARQLRGPKDGPVREYSVSVVEGVHVVECVFPAHDSKIVWHIDPAKGWNCVRSELFENGESVASSMSEYVRCDDGTWFPESVEYYTKEMEPVALIQVTAARINSPDLPDRLTPEAIGFGSGMNVSQENADGKSATVMKYVAEGRIVTLEEYRRMLDAGETSIDARMEAFAQRLHDAATAQKEAAAALESRAKSRAVAPASRPTDEWERYTLDFIDRFRLDSEQTQRAMLVLLQCEERRDIYLKSREAQFSKLRRELDSTEGAKRESAKTRLAGLQKPVDDIFERQLKPRLEKLPTRKQRQAGESATQPAGVAP